MKVRLPQGMGGGPSNMQSMLKQAQKMQEDMANVQAELEEREFTASSGGGVVEVVMNGKKELTQKEVAEIMNISQSYICFIKNLLRSFNS